MSAKPYSYRDDAAVPAFDDTPPLIIFDGLCVLCAGGVQWMLARDPDGCCRFAAIQEPIPQALYRHFGLDAAAFDTFLVLSEGVAHTKWAGVLAAARTLPQPWRALAMVGCVIPRSLGDWLYDIVQRHRLNWFGKRLDVFNVTTHRCLAPQAMQRRRLLSN